MEKKKLDEWLWIVIFGLKKLKFKSNGKDVTFHFDKLVPTFREQLQIQKKIWFENFDFTQIKGEVRKQLLQVYKPGTRNYVDGFYDAIKGKEIEYGNSFLESIRPYLLKMQVLDVLTVTFPSPPSMSHM